MKAQTYDEIIADRKEFKAMAKQATDPKSAQVKDLVAKLKSVKVEECTPYLMKLLAPTIELR